MQLTKIISYLVMIFFASLFGFLLCELALRTIHFITTKEISAFSKTFHSNVQSDPMLGYRLRPNFLSDTQSINQHGFRGKPFKLNKPKDTVRIITIGGSTSFGTSVKNLDTYPFLLEQKLRKIKPHVEVINAGVSGYHSYHQLKRLPSLLALKPDLILLYTGWNDYGVAITAQNDYRPNMLRGSGAISDITKRSYATKILLSACGYSMPCTQLKNYYVNYKWALNKKNFSAASKIANLSASNSKAKQSIITLTPEKFKIVQENYKQNLQKIIQLAKANQTPIVLATMPALLPLDTMHVPFSEKHKEPSKFYIGYITWQQKMIKTQMELAKLNHIPIIHSAQAFESFDFESRRAFFSDIMHLTPQGNDFLSSVFSNALAPLL